MEKIELDSQIEAILFWKGEPQSIKKLAVSLGKKEEEIKASLEILKEKLDVFYLPKFYDKVSLL